MKKSYKFIIIAVICLTVISVNILAQAPPPPPPSHGETGNVPGGNAPIASGLFILLGLAASYGGKKLYDLRKKKLEE